MDVKRRFWVYAIIIKISFSSPRYHSVGDLASSGVRTVTEFNLSQTSVRRCHGSWQNSPHKDDFAFISITNIHQCLVMGKFKVQKSIHSLNIGHRYCDLHFLKRYYFRGLPNWMFCFGKMIETQAQLYKNMHNKHHIPFYGVKRKKWQKHTDR